MSKRFRSSKQSLIVVALASLSAAVSLGVLLAHGPTVAAQDTIEVKIATVAPDGTPWEKQLKAYKRHLEQGSGGRFRVKMFMGGALGGEKALVRRTSQGSIQVFGGSTAALGSIVPELDIIESPFLFQTVAQADRALDSAEVKAQVKAALERRGFVFGFWAENGFRSWYTKTRQIRTPADIRGLRMRSQEAGIHLATYRALGANPVPIDVTNVLTSLQTGVVDGFDNTPLFTFATSWYQGARYLTLSQHCYQPGIIAYSKTWYDALPDDLKAVVTNVPDAIISDGRSGVRRMDPLLIQNLERANITVVRLSDAERNAFAQATRTVADTAATDATTRSLLAALRRR